MIRHIEVPASSARPVLPEHDAEGPREDPQVRRQARVAHVPQLQLLPAPVLPGGVVAVGHLPPAGDAGPHREHLVTVVPELVGLVERHGPRADHAHVSRQDVYELRDLVQARLADESAELGHARVAVDLLFAPPLGHLGLVEVPLGMLVRVRVHRAELVDADLAPVLADAPLAEHRPAGALEGDRRAERDSGDQKDGQHACRETHIERALHHAIP